ncbi:MAG: hypothetical protein HY709_06445 [Candidatus Latescibacteria bacterium]|nr:hypothetical protein [Candidatus Latescibacterota bacterium]
MVTEIPKTIIGTVMLLLFGVVQVWSTDWCVFSITPLERVQLHDAPRVLAPQEAEMFERSHAKSLRLTVAPGQCEPFAFAVYSKRALMGLKISFAQGRTGTPLPADWLDPYICKPIIRGVGGWYGKASWRPALPEMLVKDNGLWSVDLTNRMNAYHWPNADQGAWPEDAVELLPADLPANEVLQYYVRVNVPGGAKPGDYSVRVDVSAGQEQNSLEVELSVLPITLLPSVKNYLGWCHIDCDVTATDPAEGQVPSDPRRWSSEKYHALLKDWAHHGWVPRVNAANPQSLDAVIGWMRALGMLVSYKQVQFKRVASFPGYGKDPKELIKTAQRSLTSLARVQEKGLPPVLTYTDMDMISSSGIWTFVPAWYVSSKMGMPNSMTGIGNNYLKFRDFVEAPVFEYGAHPGFSALAHRYHEKTRTYFHAKPMITQPWSFNVRMTYGFGMWRDGCDGAFPYVMQTATIDKTDKQSCYWVAAQNPKWDVWGIAAPTRTRQISTLTFESMRDAVTDTRYCTTLAAQIAVAKRLGLNLDLVREVEDFLQVRMPSMLPRHADFYACVWGPATLRDGRIGYETLQQIRRQVVDYLLRLQQAHPELHTAKIAVLPDIMELARLQSYEQITPSHDTMGLVVAQCSNAIRHLVVSPVSWYRDNLKIRERVCFYPGDDIEAWEAFREAEFRRFRLQEAYRAYARLKFFQDIVEAVKLLHGPKGRRREQAASQVDEVITTALGQGVIDRQTATSLEHWAASAVVELNRPAEVTADLIKVFENITLLNETENPWLTTIATSTSVAVKAGWIPKQDAEALNSFSERITRKGLDLNDARRLATNADRTVYSQATFHRERVVKNSTAGTLLQSVCKLGAAGAVLSESGGYNDKVLGNLAAIEAYQMLCVAREDGIITQADLSFADVFGWPSHAIGKELARSLQPVGTVAGEWEVLYDPFDQGVGERWFDFSVRGTSTEKKDFYGSWTWVRGRMSVPAANFGGGVFLQIGRRHGSNPCERLWVNQQEVAVEEHSIGGGWGALTLIDVTDSVRPGQVNDFAMTYILPNVPEMRLVTLADGR